MTAHDHGSHSGHTTHLHGLLKALTVPAERLRRHLHAGHGTDEESSPFAELMGEVMATAERFGHRQHVQLTWLAVRRHGTSTAVDVVSDGIQRTARYAGATQKYNATVSRAWVELVGHHADQSGAPDFDTFADQHPALLDKKLLNRFYHSATLASPQARTGWVEPDVAAFPWHTVPLPGRATPAAPPTAPHTAEDQQVSPHKRQHVSRVVLHTVTGLAALGASAQTAISPPNAFARGFAIVEIAAACLFLLPTTMRIGGSILLTQIVLVYLLHGLQGEWPGPWLLVEGAAIALILAHRNPDQRDTDPRSDQGPGPHVRAAGTTG